MSRIDLAVKASTPRVIGPFRVTLADLQAAGPEGLLMAEAPPDSLVLSFWARAPRHEWVQAAPVSPTLSDGLVVTLQPGTEYFRGDLQVEVLGPDGTTLATTNYVYATGPDPLTLTFAAYYPLPDNPDAAFWRATASSTQVVLGSSPAYGLALRVDSSDDYLDLNLVGTTAGSVADGPPLLVRASGELRVTFNSQVSTFTSGDNDLFALIVPAI